MVENTQTGLLLSMFSVVVQVLLHFPVQSMFQSLVLAGVGSSLLS
jgi:hypothetical protein